MRKWHSVYFHRRYQPVPDIRARCPKTVALLDRLTAGACRDSMVSVVGPGGRIALHQDPDNLFLTCHLGIIIPDGCGMHLAGETRGWQEGRCIVFNAAFEHHVWNDSRSARIVLLADFLHPDFTPLERRFLTEYFSRRGEPAPAQPMPQANLKAS
jgi:aspartate beta-hydroxylase